MLMPPPLMVAEFREIVLLLIRRWSRLLMPPPLPLAEFSVTELLLIVSNSSLKMPPPLPVAEFPEIVLLLSVSNRSLKMPPPLPVAEFPEIVLLLSVRVPRLKMPPPSWPAEFPEIVLLLIVSEMLLKMPPPRPEAEFPEIVLLLIVSKPVLTMPPPTPLSAFPWVSVSPAIVTLLPASTSKIRDVLLPLIVSWLAPSPLIVNSELIDNCVPPSVMVCPASPAANWIVSAPEVPTAPSTVVPVLAAWIASRNVTSPLTVRLSKALVTVMIAGTIRSSSRSSHQDVPHRRLRRPRFARPIQPRTTDTK